MRDTDRDRVTEGHREGETYRQRKNRETDIIRHNIHVRTNVLMKMFC